MRLKRAFFGAALLLNAHRLKVTGTFYIADNWATVCVCWLKIVLVSRPNICESLTHYNLKVDDKPSNPLKAHSDCVNALGRVWKSSSARFFQRWRSSTRAVWMSLWKSHDLQNELRESSPFCCRPNWSLWSVIGMLLIPLSDAAASGWPRCIIIQQIQVA